MVVIGIVGGVASGKSLVAEYLQTLGAPLLDGDKTGHEVLREPAVRAALQQRWGAGVVNAEGEIDRPAVARLVFGEEAEKRENLNYLESITHPRIGERLRQQAKKFAANGAPAVVLDAPVMFKAGWDKICDFIVLVDAPRALRLKRAQARGWSSDGFTAREAAQESIAFKRERADFVIDNSGSVEHTREQLEHFWQKIQNV